MDEFPNVDDESIVNAFIIELLEQSAKLVKCNLSESTFDRVPLQIGKPRGKAIHGLHGWRPQAPSGEKIQAAVEAKEA